jgi:hypothetical protein
VQRPKQGVCRVFTSLFVRSIREDCD